MLLVLVPSILALVPLAFVVGLSISPTIVAAIGLVEALVPARQLTEGLTWATTGVGFGIAIGSSVAGRVVEASGARAGYAVTLGAGLATALIALAGSRWLRSKRDNTTPDGVEDVHAGRSASLAECRKLTARWVNWARNQRAHPMRTATPTSPQDVVAIVRDAARDGLPGEGMRCRTLVHAHCCDRRRPPASRRPHRTAALRRIDGPGHRRVGNDPGSTHQAPRTRGPCR